MISTAMSRRDRSKRGSTLAAALALVFLIFAVTTIMLTRIASIYAETDAKRAQTSALFLAEAGIQKAAHRLTQSSSYKGEIGTRLPTGTFDVEVLRNGSRYAVTSTGNANSPVKRHPRMTVRAVAVINGSSFRIVDWRENR